MLYRSFPFNNGSRKRKPAEVTKTDIETVVIWREFKEVEPDPRGGRAVVSNNRHSVNLGGGDTPRPRAKRLVREVTCWFHNDKLIRFEDQQVAE